jgi:hypothetical protein
MCRYLVYPSADWLLGHQMTVLNSLGRTDVVSVNNLESERRSNVASAITRQRARTHDTQCKEGRPYFMMATSAGEA